jgi:hypothetical protein
MYDKRKQKIAASTAPYLDAGETVGASAIVQTPKDAARAVFGKKSYEQYLATATDEHFYVFAISPIKNEVFGEGFQKLPLANLDARMDKSRAVIGDFTLSPLQPEKQLGALVEFVQQRRA